MEEPDRQISVETLYRKWATIREGDYGALVDMRGKARKGMSKMPEAIERVFLSLFLDESQLPVPRCIALTEEWAQQNMPEAMPLPGYHTFYRKAKAVPYPVMVALTVTTPDETSQKLLRNSLQNADISYRTRPRP